jgi:hypothetical protein
MLHPFFAALSTHETALLLTTLTLGGRDQVPLFAHLPPEQAQRLEERANSLLSLPADTRVPLMVAELRALVEGQGQQRLAWVDPSWIVHRLRGESPRTVALILLGLPPAQMRAVLRRVPSALRRQLPPKRELAQLPTNLVRGLRLSFLAQFDPMPDPSHGPRTVHDLVHLDRSDLHRLVRVLGLIELGQAFAVTEKMALVELCRRLPRPRAEELIAAVQGASTVDRPDPASAARFLTRVVVNFEDTEEFLQRSGLWRLARALIDEPETFVRAMVQRLPRRSGTVLGGYVTRARELEHSEPEAISRLRDGILVRNVLLMRAQDPTSPWATGPIAFADPPACEAALAEEAARQPALGRLGTGEPDGSGHEGV